MFLAGDQVNKSSHVPYWWIIGSLAVGLVVIVVVVLLFVFLRSSSCCRGSQGSQTKESDGKVPHKFHILRNTSFCCASGRSICCKSGDWNQPNGESSNRHMNIPTGINSNLLDFSITLMTKSKYLLFTDYIVDYNVFLYIQRNSNHVEGIRLNAVVKEKKKEIHLN